MGHQRLHTSHEETESLPNGTKDEGKMTLTSAVGSATVTTTSTLTASNTTTSRSATATTTTKAPTATSSSSTEASVVPTTSIAKPASTSFKGSRLEGAEAEAEADDVAEALGSAPVEEVVVTLLLRNVDFMSLTSNPTATTKLKEELSKSLIVRLFGETGDGGKDAHILFAPGSVVAQCTLPVRTAHAAQEARRRLDGPEALAALADSVTADVAGVLEKIAPSALTGSLEVSVEAAALTENQQAPQASVNSASLSSTTSATAASDTVGKDIGGGDGGGDGLTPIIGILFVLALVLAIAAFFALRSTGSSSQGNGASPGPHTSDTRGPPIGQYASEDQLHGGALGGGHVPEMSHEPRGAACDVDFDFVLMNLDEAEDRVYSMIFGEMADGADGLSDDDASMLEFIKSHTVLGLADVRQALAGSSTGDGIVRTADFVKVLREHAADEEEVTMAFFSLEPKDEDGCVPADSCQQALRTIAEGHQGQLGRGAVWASMPEVAQDMLLSSVLSGLPSSQRASLEDWASLCKVLLRSINVIEAAELGDELMGG